MRGCETRTPGASATWHHFLLLAFLGLWRVAQRLGLCWPTCLPACRRATRVADLSLPLPQTLSLCLSNLTMSHTSLHRWSTTALSRSWRSRTPWYLLRWPMHTSCLAASAVWLSLSLRVACCAYEYMYWAGPAGKLEQAPALGHLAQSCVRQSAAGPALQRAAARRDRDRDEHSDTERDRPATGRCLRVDWWQRLERRRERGVAVCVASPGGAAGKDSR